MKGVVIAGGEGTRLRPMTHVINKHILPVYDKPMIFYPVETLLRGGIDDILVISTPDNIGHYVNLLEKKFDASFSYRVQSEPAGIAHALGLAEDFVDDTLAVILGDNIIFDDLSETFQAFEQKEKSAQLFLKQVEQPTRYGIAEVSNGVIQEITEKPKIPDSNTAVTGLYLYDQQVFDKITTIEPSERGEYEITDVNAAYLQENTIAHEFLSEPWFDVGTPEGLFNASKYVRQTSI